MVHCLHLSPRNIIFTLLLVVLGTVQVCICWQYIRNFEQNQHMFYILAKHIISYHSKTICFISCFYILDRNLITFGQESILHFLERENCRWRDLGQILKRAAAQLVVWISYASYVCAHLFLLAQTLPTIAFHNKIAWPQQSRLGLGNKANGLKRYASRTKCCCVFFNILLL